MAKKNDVVSQETLDFQEKLSIEWLQKLGLPLKSVSFGDRPKDSFIELVNWVEQHFGGNLYKSTDKSLLKANDALHRIINNRIIIDGEFLYYCDENNISVKCVYSDTMVSWKSDFDNEKFFMQGIFLIKKGDVEFLLSALLHKGNQNEDEISFFVLVNSQNIQGYIELRNDFDRWAAKRDRDNLYIRVIGGEDLPYNKDTKWDDVFLPDDLKKNIRHSIEGFLKSRSIYTEKKIPWKKGLLFFGNAGNGKSLLIKTIISNYDFKPVTVLSGANDDLVIEAFSYAEQQSPALLYFEDLDSLLQNINISLFLNLLDGISSNDGILVVATANDLTNIKSNIKDRPSRFDRKFEIPLPDIHMSSKYLKKWFGNSIKDSELKELALYVVKYEFSYAYLKELYISSVYNSLAEDRKDPIYTDIKLALEQLMFDKFKKTKQIGIDKYFTKENNGKNIKTR